MRASPRRRSRGSSTSGRTCRPRPARRSRPPSPRPGSSRAPSRAASSSADRRRWASSWPACATSASPRRSTGSPRRRRRRATASCSRRSRAPTPSTSRPVIEFMIAPPGRGHHLRGPAARHEHRDRPGAAAGRRPRRSSSSSRSRRRPSRRSSSTTTAARGWPRPHLLALGRRRIGHLAGPAAWREAQDRHDGWLRRAARRRPRARARSSPATGRRPAARPRFEQLLALDPDLDGIFVANDQMALGRPARRQRAGDRDPGRHRRRRVRRARRGRAVHARR